MRRGGAGPRLALIASLALPLPSCHDAERSEGVPDARPPIASTADAAPPPPAASPYNIPPPPATLTLLYPGRPPRRALRYTWRPDQREELTIDLRTVAASAASPAYAPPPSPTGSEGDPDARPPSLAPAIPLAPPVHIVVAIDPLGLGADGDFRYAWRVTSAGITPRPGSPDPITEGMRAEVAAIDHLSGKGDVSARGLAGSVTIDPESLADAGTTGQMVEQVQQTLREVAAPFPDEEVGLGARWQKISQLVARDARVTQTETFTLRELKPTTGTLDDTLAQTTGGARALPGAQARIESMLVSASAKTRFDLARLVPQTRFESTSTMVLSGPTDRSGPVTMVLRVEILLSGATR